MSEVVVGVALGVGIALLIVVLSLRTPSPTAEAHAALVEAAKRDLSRRIRETLEREP